MLAKNKKNKGVLLRKNIDAIENESWGFACLLNCLLLAGIYTDKYICVIFQKVNSICLLRPMELVYIYVPLYLDSFSYKDGSFCMERVYFTSYTACYSLMNNPSCL